MSSERKAARSDARKARRAERRARRSERREDRPDRLVSVIEALCMAAEMLGLEIGGGAEKRAWVIDMATDLLCLPEPIDGVIDDLISTVLEAVVARLFNGGEE